ncbi:MAG: hypothetical protein D3916_09655 [Candidatus Electrothrix sp. MAN1_4]|nr:hypothetical protein [Candidatus Electrothrix sp. MAN1_4]
MHLLNSEAVRWILIHIEVQGDRDDSFEERMYVYNYRIFDKYRKDVVSIAVLIDGSRNFRPCRFLREQFGCSIVFTFPMIKLLDFDIEKTAKRNNPFAIVTRVQLAKLHSGGDVDKRYSFRMELTKELYQKNYSKEQIFRLYRFIDYVLKLPKPKALEFKKELEIFEEARKMPYITSTERIAREEGRLQGLKQGRNKGQLEEARKAVFNVLKVRFGKLPDTTQEKIVGCDDLSRLERLLQQAVQVQSLTEFGQ